MRKYAVIILLVFAVFLFQFFIYNIIGSQWTPHLLLLLLIFITLVLGIRHGLLAAFLIGLLLDSYSAELFGLNILSMIACAYLTVLIHKYIFRSGSKMAIVFLTFLVLLFDVIIKFYFHILFGYLNWREMTVFVLVPQIGITLLASTFVFRGLRQCASKLFV